jgi:hypothetical protein
MDQRKTSRRLRLALRSLRALIGQGVEFPDAHFQASQRYHLTEQQDRELVALYDTAEVDSFEIISLYTRAQAIADGSLVDVSGLAKEAGFRWPVAVTRGVWAEVVTPTPHNEQEGQSKKGRLWDTLSMARLAAKANKDDRDSVLFKVLVLRDRKHRKVTLKLVLSFESPEGGPCLTIMLPNED